MKSVQDTPFSEKSDVSFAFSPAAYDHIEAIIQRKIAAGPQERVEFISNIKNRLVSLKTQLTRMEDPSAIGHRKATEDPALIERRRIADAYAEAQAVIKSLPVELRGKISLPHLRQDQSSDLRTLMKAS